MPLIWPALQIGLHLLGDEEAEAQDRAQRALDIVKRGADAAARQFGQVRHRAHRLQRAQHIGRRLGIERVGVEEVRSAEHVEHGRPRRRQIGVRPGPDFRKLALLELRRRRCRRIWRAAARTDPWSAASAANRLTAACRRGSARCRRRSRCRRRAPASLPRGTWPRRRAIFADLKHPIRGVGDVGPRSARLRKTA